MHFQTETIDVRRKRLAWRASRRGIREMDLLIGGYANANLAQMSPQELDDFERVLDIPDQSLLAWATGVEAIPPEQDCELLRKLLAHRPLDWHT